MLTSPRPAEEEPEPITADGLLTDARWLLRESGQDTAVVGLILTLIAFGVIGRFGAGLTLSPVRSILLLVLIGGFLIAGSLALRARLTLVRTLGDIRVRVGAPIDPGVPWTPLGTHGEVGEDVLRRELQRLIGAAHRSLNLAVNALVWSLVTALVFLLWLLV